MVVHVGLAVSAVAANVEVDVIRTRDVSQSTSSASADMNQKERALTAGTEAAAATAINNLDAVDDQTDSSSSMIAEHLDTESRCFLRQLSDTSQHRSVPASSKSGAVFLKSSWRQHLCRCPNCLVNLMYFLCCVGCSCVFILIMDVGAQLALGRQDILPENICMKN